MYPYGVAQHILDDFGNVVNITDKAAINRWYFWYHADYNSMLWYAS